MNVLISIGKAQLKHIGLNPQRVAAESASRLPAHPTFRGVDHQKTGMGERTAELEVLTLPHIFGGLDALGWLKQHHKKQDTVNYYRLGANYLGNNQGAVVIRELFIDEERLHPWTGRGRILKAEFLLVFVGDA